MHVAALLLLIGLRIVDVGVLLAVRALVARRFGYAGFLPLVVATRVNPRAGWIDRGLASLSGLTAVYLVSAMLFTGATSLQGRYEATSALTVEPESAAESAGLRTNDVVLAVQGVPVSSPDDVMPALRAHKDPSVRIRVRRGSEALEFEVARRVENGTPRAGLSVQMEKRSVGFGEAMGVGAVMPARTLAMLITSILGPPERAMRGATVSVVGETARALEEGAGSALGMLGAVSAYLLPLYGVLAVVLVFVGWRDLAKRAGGRATNPDPS